MRVTPSRHVAWLGDAELDLTPAEFALLLALARDPGHTLNRQQLIDAAFGNDFDGFERTIDTHVKNLRRKMMDAGVEATPAIVTVYGVGYRLKAP